MISLGAANPGPGTAALTTALAVLQLIFMPPITALPAVALVVLVTSASMLIAEATAAIHHKDFGNFRTSGIVM